MRGDLCEGIVTIKIEEGNQRAVSLNQKSQFGKLSEDCLELSIIEACYLMESGRLDIYENDKNKWLYVANQSGYYSENIWEKTIDVKTRTDGFIWSNCENIIDNTYDLETPDKSN